jgi:N-acetylglucosaminyldiphosphoundecaprenol N-acetyl-beta-D-mannosaminyltransferase
MVRPRLRLGQLEIDVLGFAEALLEIERLVDAGAGGAIFTPNVDHVVQAQGNPAFARAYARASLSLADGAPLVWASHLLGQALPERVAGADLVLPVLALAGRRHWRVSLLGTSRPVAERAAAIARERCGASIVSVDSPEVNVEDARQVEAIAQRLATAGAQLVLVALGAPKQELLIDRVLERVRPAVLLGIGAGLDFIAGAVQRAPPLLRKAGLEWAFRLVKEPRRLWRRYLLRDPAFLAIVARALLEARGLGR